MYLESRVIFVLEKTTTKCKIVTASALVARFTPNNDFTKHTHTPAFLLS